MDIQLSCTLTSMSYFRDLWYHMGAVQKVSLSLNSNPLFLSVIFVYNQFVATAVQLHRDRGLEEEAMFQSYQLL